MRSQQIKKLLNVFARFACQICDSRECWLRQLSSEATKQQFAEIFGMRFDISQTFRSFRLHTCIFWLHGVFWVYVFAHLNPKDSPRLDRVSVSPHHFPQHCGVDLRRLYLHSSVVITVLRVLFAGVLSQFCLSWRPRGLDSSPTSPDLQHLSRF